MKKIETLEIEMKELTENRRYGLIIKGVQIGLRTVGIKDVSLSMPTVKEGRLVFTVEREVVDGAIV